VLMTVNTAVLLAHGSNEDALHCSNHMFPCTCSAAAHLPSRVCLDARAEGTRRAGGHTLTQHRHVVAHSKSSWVVLQDRMHTCISFTCCLQSRDVV
jgi:hypothetical protein